jgi:3-oxoacyl-[acyl-carrier-protein] synthase II
MGCVTPLGTTVPQLWANLKEGKSGVGFTTIFDATNFPTRISAEVKDWSLAHVGEDTKLWEKRGRHTKFAIGAARQAVNDSGVLGTVDPDKFGVYLGAGEGQQDFHNFSHMMVAALKNGELDLAAFIQEGLKRLDPQLELEQEPNMPAAYMATHFGAEGPNFNCLTACAASSQAVGEATEIIRRGEADVMLSGGAHSMIHPFGVTGFNLLTALSENNAAPQKASRPFDLNRDGFILGEGAAVVVLEDYEHAKKRGAPIYGEILGYGTTADAFRITDTHPEGRGAITCMKMALRDAQKNPTDIDYINAHGTSTPENDKMEHLGVSAVFGEGIRNIPISSNKSMIGHTLTAAGAVEAVVSLMTLEHQRIPPTINHHMPDPGIALDVVPNVARDAKMNRAISNSFGFGGQNVCLVLAREPA